MADGGARQAVKLQQKLYGDAQRGGNQKDSQIFGRKPHSISEQHRQHSQHGKEKAIEHHIFHAHLIERQPAAVKAHTPKASRQSTRSVTKPVRRRTLCHFCPAHLFFYFRIDVLQNEGARVSDNRCDESSGPLRDVASLRSYSAGGDDAYRHCHGSRA